MKQTGQILRENREKLGLTIHEISLALKINSRIIKAMEEGNSGQLPPRTFLRGFVQSYASYLKLDMDQLMETFQDEMEPRKVEATEPHAVGTSPEGAPKKAAWQQLSIWNGSSSKMTSTVIGVIALTCVISIVVISRTIEKYQQESKVFAPPENVQALSEKNNPTGEDSSSSPSVAKETSTPIATTGALSPIPASAPEHTNVADHAPAATTTVDHPAKSTTPVPVSSLPKPPATAAADAAAANKPDAPKIVQVIKPDLPKPATVAKVDVVKTEAPKAAVLPKDPPKPVAGAEKKPEPAKVEAKVAPVKPDIKTEVKIDPPRNTAQVTVAATPEADKKVVAGSPQELILEALDKVSVEVQIDGGTPQNLSMSADQIRTFKAKKTLRLKLSDGGAVSVIHNGKDSGVPGDLGKPISLTYPK